MSAERTGSVPPPKLLAMVLADTVHIDTNCKKASILGTFDRIYSDVYPCTVNLVVYLAVTNGRNVVPFRLLLVDINQERAPIFEGEFAIQFNSPTETWEDGIRVSQAELPSLGDYVVQLFAGDDFLGDRRLTALPRSAR